METSAFRSPPRSTLTAASSAAGARRRARNGSRSSRPAANCAASPPTPRRCSGSLPMRSTSPCSTSTNICCAARIARVRKLGRPAHQGDLPRASGGSTRSTCSWNTARWAVTRTDIHRRFCWLTSAAPRLSVTFHTLLMPPAFDAAAFATALAPAEASRRRAASRGSSAAPMLSSGVARQLRRTQRHKPVTAIVAQPARPARCALSLRHRDGLRPPAVLSRRPTRWRRSATGASRAAISRCSTTCRPTPVLIGVFGFLNDYKGIGTAIRRCSICPKTTIC